jgi:hypothetical protein
MVQIGRYSGPGRGLSQVGADYFSGADTKGGALLQGIANAVLSGAGEGIDIIRDIYNTGNYAIDQINKAPDSSDIVRGAAKYLASPSASAIEKQKKQEQLKLMRPFGPLQQFNPYSDDDYELGIGMDDTVQKQLDELNKNLKNTTKGATDPNVSSDVAPEDEGLPSDIIKTDTTQADATKTDDEENSPEANLLKAGMDAYKDALGETPTVGTIEDYKKDFEKATGIDASGKVDKSTALTALGLALMQNKAGKGFNVGNMLSEIGKAGEKALPKLEAAKREARAGKLAAGQYALSERAKDRQALVARNQNIANKIFEISKMEYSTDKAFELQRLKEIQSLNEIALQNEAALAESAYNDAKDAGKLGELKTITIPGLSKEDNVTYQAQQVGDSDTFRVQNPTGLLRSLNGKYKGAQGGLKTVQIMKQAAMSGETTGFKGVYNNLSSMFKGAVSAGVNPEADIQEGMNETEAYRRATGKLLIEFRKLLTGGEAGNAISDRDVAIIEENLGKTDFISFKSTAEILGAIEGIESIFTKRAQMYGDQKTSYLEALTNSGQIGGISKELLQDFGTQGDYTDDFIAYVPELVGGQLVYKLPKS